MRLAPLAAALVWLTTSLALAQHEHPSLPMGAEREWPTWVGRDTAFLRTTLGAPDAIRRGHWHYDGIIVGYASSGPYTRYDLDIVVRRDHIVSVNAVQRGSVACIVSE